MKTAPNDQPKLYIGIDIHKRSWKIHYATYLFLGKFIPILPKPELLQEYLNKHFSGHYVTTTYEAGCFGYYAHRIFDGYGWHSLVVNPAIFTERERSNTPRRIRSTSNWISRESKELWDNDGVHRLMRSYFIEAT